MRWIAVMGMMVLVAAQTALAVEGRWAKSVPLHPDAREFFVAPDGSPRNAGTKDQPWDLGSVLSDNKQVKPGDIIWLRGGRYGSGGATLFTNTLTGTEQRPIFLRQYPGEHAIIDGGIEGAGAWVWFWGFEITNSSENRRVVARERPAGLNLTGRGHKAVNLIIHDAGHPGIGFWAGVGDTGEIHGCLLWGNGLYDMGDKRFPNGWTRGSPIYAQNKEGTRYITDVIAFRNFTTGMKAYGEGGFVNGFHIEGNITFDSPDWNILASGMKNPMERLKVIGNMTYRRPGDPVQESVQLGYYESQNLDVEVRDNYFVLGTANDRGFFLKKFRDAKVTGNTLIGQGILAHWMAGLPGGSIDWNDNQYIATDGPAKFMLEKQQLSFDQWRQQGGLDAKSRLSQGRPTETRVFVRPNVYQPGRGHVVVYNWAGAKRVKVDLSRILRKDETFVIRDAQNFFGQPIVRGTYTGGEIELAMDLSEIAKPTGEVKHMPPWRHTAPGFGVFVVLGDDRP